MSTTISRGAMRAYCDDRFAHNPALAKLMYFALLDHVTRVNAYFEPIPDGSEPPAYTRHPDWQSGIMRGYQATPAFDAQVEHIADWLAMAITQKHAWIKDTVKGRTDNPHDYDKPRRFCGLYNMDELKAMADDAIQQEADRLRGLVSLGIDEETVMKFDDGYRIVRLTSPLALDAESAYMRHCIGLGSYDKRIGDTHEYYSLRDPKNQPHVSFEVMKKNNQLIQLEGKQNKPPIAKYMPYVLAFAKREKFDLGQPSYDRNGRTSVEKSGLFMQDGRYYSIHDLPEGFRFARYHSAGNLNLDGVPVEHLPKGFSVRHYDHDTRFADFSASDTPIEHFPDDMRVDGNFTALIRNLKTIGRNTTIGRNCHITSANLIGLPENFSVGQRCEIDGHTIEEQYGKLSDKKWPNRPLAPLPPGLNMGHTGNGSAGFVLEHFQDIEFPMDMRVKGELTVRYCDRLVVPARHYDVTWMNIADVKQVEMADGISITGSLIIRGDSPKKLPENLTIGGDLDLSESNISELPASLKVGGIIKPSIVMQNAPVEKAKPKRGIKPADIVAQRGDSPTQRA